MADPLQTVQMMTPAEAKRRRSTPDAAKASYLTSQLRLRLQYAKLKVEHGWQRQNLNEVENLYFRHTHKGRPPPTISPGGRRNLRNAPQHSSDTFSSTSISSVLSTHERTEDAGNGVASGSLQHTDTQSRTPDASAQASQISTPHTQSQASPHPSSGSGSAPSPPTSLARTDTLEDATAAATTTSPRGLKRKHPGPDRTLSSASTATLTDSGFASQASLTSAPTHSSLPATATSAPTQTLTMRANLGYPHFYPHTHVPYPALSPAPAPAPAPFGTGSGAGMSSGAGAGVGGLTYDAFWSTHGSAAAYRSVLTGAPSSGAGGVKGRGSMTEGAVAGGGAPAVAQSAGSS
ncbi:hypothetical protein CERSUDRAFT_112456 [Gelatoporia subvermispora B]|uniref:Uncharacterized protein n=1 Tax=Ceriporiopsis subvermispora (strain B) TaxID=914234 RepID=M2R2G6_CERS8|nr:hypothetical protein CERSUDRAFT_112456 [Gelatoporia subvermispora B]